jgi:hypothetical protein
MRRRLALPVSERAVVSAAVGETGGTEVVGRDELGGCARVDLDAIGRAAGGEVDVAASPDRDGDPRRSEASDGEGDRDPRRATPAGGRPLEERRRQAVAAHAALCLRPGEREVGDRGEMPGVGNAGAEEGRLEEARVVVPHDLGRRDGGEVGGPLMLAPRAERLAEAEEDEGAGEERGKDAEEEEAGLTGLGASRPRHLAASQWAAVALTIRVISGPRRGRPARRLPGPAHPASRDLPGRAGRPFGTRAGEGPLGCPRRTVDPRNVRSASG